MRVDACRVWTAVAALGLACGESRSAAIAAALGSEQERSVPAELSPAELSEQVLPEGTPELGAESTPELAAQEGTPLEASQCEPSQPPPGAAPLEPTPPMSEVSKIEIEMTRAVDDFVYASVDGIRKKVWYIDEPDQNRRIDVTSWFGGGEHALRLQAINTVGPTSYGVRVWVDGAVALEAPCAPEVCNGDDAPRGIVFDRTLTLTTRGPRAQAVRVTSAVPGKLYVDDAFTGISTTGTEAFVSVSLPPGEHTIGLGVSDDSPPDYSGSYFERTVTLSNAAVDVDFPASATPLPMQERTSIALVPIRRFVVDTFDPSEVGVLTDRDVSDLDVLSQATRDEWLEPFSYGLASWELDLLPVVEDVALHASTHDANPDADTFLRDAGLEHLRDEYEIVLLYYDLFDAEGNLLGGVVNGSAVEVPIMALGGGGLIWFNTAFAGIYGDLTGPNPALLHEALHNYEGYNEQSLHFYLGADGMHGGEEHGYYSGDNGELDFALYQRLYLRNQVAEVDNTRVDVLVAAPPPEASLWVGVFDTMRRGYSPLL